MTARFLFISVFITGAALLVIEILANRMLSPYFGGTLYNTSAILATVLGGLSIGYWLGGKAATSKNIKLLFVCIILLIGIFTLAIGLVYTYFLAYIQQIMSPMLGSLVSSVILFLVPSVFFGLLSPIAIVILDQETKQNTLGSKVGNMYAISTMGSIFGSLLTGFVLLPYVPVDIILKSIAILLLVLALIGAIIIKNKIVMTATTMLSLAAVISFFLGPTTTVVASVNGQYNHITVTDGMWNYRPTRFFLMDQQLSAAKYKDNAQELVFDYTQYYDAYKKFDVTPKNIAVIGGAAYSIPQAYVQENSGVQVDVYEIEEKTIEVANQYFDNAATHPRIHTLVGDARIELKKSMQKYDVIFIDAYSGINAIPWQLTTVEFYQIVEEHLAPGGVVISNTIVNIAPGSTKVLDSYVKTQKELFGYISVYNAVDKVASQTTVNAMIIAINSKKAANSVAMKYITQDRFVKSNIDLGYLNGGIVLRDNYAPIEYFGLEELIH